MSDTSSKRRHFPDKPGVYLFKDGEGRVIYVGKAKSIRKRVASYFTKSQDSPKTIALIESFKDIEFIVTTSELEAIMLESNLIKKHRPRYNVILKDNKEYPYIKLTVNEDWPRLLLVRKIINDGAKYFGPYESSTVKETLKLLKRLFPIRPCKQTPMKMRQQPCMYFHIKRCQGPCVGGIDQKSYMALCKEAVELLQGRSDLVLSKLRVGMKQASDSMEYEKAKELRDRIRKIEKLRESQSVISVDLADRDVIALSKLGGEVCAVVFQIRGGKLIGRDVFYLSEVSSVSDGELMSSIIKQYYVESANVPPEIVIGGPAEEPAVIKEFLSKKRGGRVEVIHPNRGSKLSLVRMARDNARTLLERKFLSGAGKETSSVIELKKKLYLDTLPARIEAFDVSNIQGTDMVGSMVTFVSGLPHKSHYRKFRVLTLKDADDVRAMYEIVRRRYSGTLKAELPLPDLVLIDGGPAQVNFARKALDDSGLFQMPVIGLAKKFEEIYMVNKKEPLRLPRDSKALHLLQRIRDEAHRFAVTYHRLRRGKRIKG